MLNKKILIYLVLPVIVILLLSFAFFKIKKTNTLKEKYDYNLFHKISKNKSRKSEIVIIGAKIKEICEKPKHDFVIQSQECSFMQSTQKIKCKNVVCKAQEKQSNEICLKADSALIDRQSKQITFTGNTSGYFNGSTIKGSNVLFDISNNTIKSNDPISCKHPMFTATSKKIEFDIKKNSLKMDQSVRFEFFITHDKRQLPQ
jgi:LPS export ABC transporter protein LptC